MRITTRYTFHLPEVFFLTTFFIGFLSCSQKAENNKEIIQEYNEAKFAKSGKEKDTLFLVSAANINLEEIRLGQLAQRNGTSDEVKDLGKMMEDAHSRFYNALKDFAAKKSIDIPTSLGDDRKSSYWKLSDKTGNDFDKKYCDIIVNGHQEAIGKFEMASKESTDINIKEWAGGMIPVLRAHLNSAARCQKQTERKLSVKQE